MAGTRSSPSNDRALTIAEKAHGPENPDVANGLENYAVLLRELGRTTGAEKLEERVRAIRGKAQ